MPLSVFRFAPCVLLLAAAQASASGRIDPSPIEPQKFPDFAACKRHLQQEYANDQARVASPPQAEPGRAAPERSIHTEGVVQAGRHEARYRVELGYLSRSVDHERKMLRSQYSYEDKLLTCKRRTLTGEKGRGYHLESYQPIE